MNFFLLLIMLSSSLLAQDQCGPKGKKVDCQKSIHDAIFFKEYDKVQKIIDKHGIKLFFESEGVGGPYAHIRIAEFFKITPVFKMLSRHSGYPADIPDKNQFLMAALPDIDFRERDPEFIKLLFNNNDKSKNLEWWENENWPYPLLNNFKKQISAMKDNSKYRELIQTFDQIDDLKKNICQIDSVASLEAIQEKYKGVQSILKNSSSDLLSCAVKSGNLELVSHLIENELFPYSSLSTLVTHLSQSEVNKTNLTLLTRLKKKMGNLKITHPDRKTQQTFWAFEHLSEDVDCLLAGDHNPLVGLKSFSELSQQIVFSAFLKEAQKLKEATVQKDGAKKNESMKNIIDLIVQSNMPVNFKDASGKTIMHHLAAYADFAAIESFERAFNNEYGGMNYEIQDKQGNTPLHIALINKNLSGSLALSDSIIQSRNGFSYGNRNDVKMKNSEGNTPLDIIKNFDANHEDKKTLKTIKHWIKEHIDPKGRFDDSSY